MFEFLKTSRGALLLALVYFVFPLDLVPDIFGPIGRLDDLAILGFVMWRLFQEKSATHSTTKKPRAAQTDTQRTTAATDPYSIFQINPGASREEIDSRYRELAKDYHPDRVAHLGEDLRKVAHEKMIEIQRAYDILSRKASQS